jgi:alkylated DNA repair dioxygenase AlkB
MDPVRINLIDDKDSLVYTIKNGLSPQMSEELLVWYQSTLKWVQGKSTVYGKTFDQPRMQYMMGYNYKFSGNSTVGQKFDLPTRKLLDQINLAMGTNLNSAMFWRYREGSTDYIAQHSDSKEDLVPNTPIVGISFGDEVKWRLTNKKNPDIKHVFWAKPGMFFVMAKDTQDHWVHEAMKRKHPCDRISITFREFE